MKRRHLESNSRDDGRKVPAWLAIFLIRCAWARELDPRARRRMFRAAVNLAAKLEAERIDG